MTAQTTFHRRIGHEHPLQPRHHASRRHHGAAAVLAKDLRHAGRSAGCARAAARNHPEQGRWRAGFAGLRHLGPLHRSGRHHRRQCRAIARPHRLGQGARRRRGISGPRHQAGRQRQCRRLACGKILHRASQAAARRRRPHDHPAGIRPRRHHHQGDDLRRDPRKPRPQGAARTRRSRDRRRREFWRRVAGLRHPGIRAL